MIHGVPEDDQLEDKEQEEQDEEVGLAEQGSEVARRGMIALPTPWKAGVSVQNPPAAAAILTRAAP